MSNFAKAFLQSIAMEANATGVVAGRETEIVIYARITDFEGLKKASSKQAQEQWQVLGPFGKVRVRNESHDGVEGKYTMAIKSKDSVLGGAETEMGIDKDVFEAFKTISDNGMIKDRYCFPAQRVTMRDASGKHNVQLPDLVFEVDVYKKPDGTYHEWVKIDLEIDSILEAVKDVNQAITTADLNINIGDLPFKPVEMMENSTKDEGQRAKISQLYDTVFLTKRTNDKAASVPAEAQAAEPVPQTEPVAPVDTPTETTPVVEEVPTPDTGEITGVVNPKPAETAEMPTLTEPDAVAPVEEAPAQAAEEPKATDAPVPDVSEGQTQTSEVQDPTQSEVDKPSQQTPTEGTPEVTEAAPSTPETLDEPVTDPDTVVEAGGDETTPATDDQNPTRDDIRMIIREELAAITSAANVKAPAP